MTQQQIKIRLKGLDDIQRILRDPEFVGGPLRDFLNRVGHGVEAKAKSIAPVDTGRYRASITSEVRGTRAIVGSNVKYAPVIEFGLEPGARINYRDLIPWAKRHGMQGAAFVIARAIMRRGLPARRIFQTALERSLALMQSALRIMIKDIERRWGRG